VFASDNFSFYAKYLDLFVLFIYIFSTLNI